MPNKQIVLTNPDDTTSTAATIVHHDAKLAREIAPYLDGEEFNEPRIVKEIKFYFSQHIASGFEIGRRLIAIKLAAPHATFISLIEDDLHMSRTRAFELMTFARVITDAKAIHGGQLDIRKLQSMDKNKVLLLGQILPEYADEINEEGTIAGRDLDEWDTMSRAEIRKQVAALKKKYDRDAEKHKEAAAEGAELVNGLKDKLRHYTNADDTAVHRSCRDIQQAFHNAVHTFSKAILIATSKDHKLTPTETAHIYATKLFVDHITEDLCINLYKTFPTLKELQPEAARIIAERVKTEPAFPAIHQDPSEPPTTPDNVKDFIETGTPESRARAHAASSQKKASK